MDRYRIGKVLISITTPSDAVKKITEAVRNHVCGQICVSNVRTVSFAQSHPDYAEIMNNSFMCTPDGMPLTWMARLWGIKQSQRTTGPDLLVTMLRDKDSGIKHFLMGDTDETLDRMKNEFPDSNIVGTYSPPFCSLDEYDYAMMAEKVNASGAQVVWLSLRSPKQDYFAHRLLPLLHNKLCIGVGAAFRFGLKEYKDPPLIIKKLGLTGFFWRKDKFAETCWIIKNTLNVLCWASRILSLRLIGKKYNK